MSRGDNPLLLVKKQIMDASRRIYNVRGVTEKATHIEAVFEDVFNGHLLSPKIQKALMLYFIDRIIANRFEQNNELDIAQPDFFEDLEYKFSIPDETGKRKLIALGDVRLADIPAINKLKDSNIAAAVAERQRWNEACDLVVPLLETHPRWKWSTAVNDLRARGIV